MNRMKTYYLSFFILLAPLVFFGQQKKDIKPILEKVTSFYDTTSRYNVAIKQTLLRGKTGNNISESYSGKFTKDKSYSKLELLNSEVVEFSNVRLIIDHDSKAIEYNKTSKGVSAPIDISGFLKHYEGSSLKSTEKQWICELNVKPSAAFVPCNKILLYINKDYHFVEKQVLFLSRELPFKTKGGKTEEDFGRLEISFTHDLTMSDKVNDKVSNYIQGSGSNMTSVKKYKGYKVVNLSNK
ncbi:hypothetical protein [uncultured Aquimarina sp.]|uniref:hypothetical protein n=1 Tax=uncultured Aquimarina sp. TaxID=575652 RepID=UPI002603D563|nr:hypothetical protein [uncultured Aquimarina sp.]